EVSKNADAVTFDHEHVPNEFLDELIAAGINVQPQPKTLINAQDKLIQRQRLSELGVPVPAFTAIDKAEDAAAFWSTTGGKVCLKARRGGYDGKGVWFPDSEAELIELVAELLDKGVPLLAEEKVELVRDLYALVSCTTT